MGGLRKTRKDEGICVQCGVKLDREGICCTRCNNNNNKSKHKRVDRLHKENKCVNCAKPMDREGLFCKKCARDLKLMARVRDAYRRENGLCVQCGRPVTEYNYCQRCLDMRKDRYRRKKGL